MAGMTIDMARLSAKHTAPETKRRTRRRHWAEWRLRVYGILAILLAILALTVLLYTVVAKTLGVTEEYYLELETRILVDDRAMQRINDPNPRLLPSLDMVVRSAIIEATGQEIGRRERRQLTALLSTDAGLELGRAVKQSPDLINSDYGYDALLDDQVQLYLKGDFGRLKDAGTKGTAVLSVGDSEDQVTVDISPDALGTARELMQRDRRQESQNARRTANDQARAFDETAEKLSNVSEESERAALQKALERFREARDAASARADAAHTEATSQSAVFTLRSDDPSLFIRANGGWIKVTEMAPERLVGTIMTPLSGLGTVTEGAWSTHVLERPEAERKISDRQVIWLESFRANGKVKSVFNWRLLTSSDSSNAELAGIWGALVGSFWTMIVTFVLAFPLGVMASIYLEEFAPKNRLTEFIEVNINNLAAVPSIVFGLLGITVLLSGVHLFGVDLFDGLLKMIAEDPRSTPLAGGVVLALMSLPTIIIAARASIKAVPPSIRDAALALGASRLQAAMHHVVPSAMPGIMTGSIIAMARALGETAPLIVIGMNAFIQDPPGSPLDKANVLPSLIYLWNNQSERLFDGKTAAAITVLLIFLVLMNALAVLLRRRFERRW